jgi:hypothetical protein
MNQFEKSCVICKKNFFQELTNNLIEGGDPYHIFVLRDSYRYADLEYGCVKIFFEKISKKE